MRLSARAGAVGVGAVSVLFGVDGGDLLAARRHAWGRGECFGCQARRRCRRGWHPPVMPLRGRARRGVSFLSSNLAIDINKNVAPPSSGRGGHALRKVSSLSSSCALDLQARSLAKNVKSVGPRKPSRMPLAACATRWFPGRGRLLASPRSAGTFSSPTDKASRAWRGCPGHAPHSAPIKMIIPGCQV